MLLADTGPLVAGANSRDRYHRVCAELLENHPGPMRVPAPVVVEVCQLLPARQGAHAEATFLATIATGALKIIDLEPTDYARAAALVEQYADLPLGAVDATVVAVAERLRITEIATLDRRHFTVVGPCTSTRSRCCRPPSPRVRTRRVEAEGRRTETRRSAASRLMVVG